MSDENEEELDFISLMKKKQAESGKASVIGEALEKAELMEKKAGQHELESLIFRRENEELKEKVKKLEKENKSLKEKATHTIELLTKSEEMITTAIEDKKQMEFDLNNQIHKLEFEIDELRKENQQLKYDISQYEQLNAYKEEDQE